jgi:hypothetical protein
MKRPSQTTIIYFLVALVLVLVGVVGVIVPGASKVLVAIGSSLIAGGLASIGFGVMRYLDDNSGRASTAALTALEQKVEAVAVELQSRWKRFSDEYAEIAHSVISLAAVSRAAQLRCTSDHDIHLKFRHEFALAPSSAPVEVDIVGLKLDRFISDQFDYIIQSGKETHLRMLLQRPKGEVFESICDLEARVPQEVIRAVSRAIERLQGGTVKEHSLVWSSGSLQVQLRLYEFYQPITFFRVHNSVYVRPRVATPRGAAQRFYESYSAADSQDQFAVYKDHFQHCWDRSSYDAALEGRANHTTRSRRR